jgi:hypothetical protein
VKSKKEASILVVKAQVVCSGQFLLDDVAIENSLW